MAPYVLVLDQGGHSTRALVLDAAGSVVAQASITVTTCYLPNDCVEQDPAEILHSLRDVIADVAEQLGENCRNISAAALIVQRSSIVAIDKETGLALSPVLSWQDTRHARWLAETCKDQWSWLRQVTGLRTNAHYGVSKMRWLLDHEPVIKAAAEKNSLCITPLAGFLYRHITDSKKTMVDAGIASRTLLTEIAFPLRWSSALLDFFSIPLHVLPEIHTSVGHYGTVVVGNSQVPLRLMGGDQNFFVLAHGKQFDDSTLFINAGTGAFVQQKMNAEDVPLQLLTAALVVSANPEQSVVVAEGTVNAAATSLDWFWQQTKVKFSDKAWQDADTDSQKNAEAIPFFINRITATGSPDWLPAGESFFSREAPVSLRAIAVLESVVFALQRNMDSLAMVKPHRVLIVSGGLSKLDLFCQRLASLSGKQLMRSNDAEACARGAAAQLLPSVVNQQTYQTFMPIFCEGLSERYQQWTAVMDQLSVDVG